MYKLSSVNNADWCQIQKRMHENEAVAVLLRHLYKGLKCMMNALRDIWMTPYNTINAWRMNAKNRERIIFALICHYDHICSLLIGTWRTHTLSKQKCRVMRNRIFLAIWHPCHCLRHYRRNYLAYFGHCNPKHYERGKSLYIIYII